MMRSLLRGGQTWLSVVTAEIPRRKGSIAVETQQHPEKGENISC